MASKLLDLLDQLEAAIPDMRAELGGDMGEGEEGEGELPPMDDLPLPEEEGDEGMGDEAPADLDLPPMLKKKKPAPLPF
jgi:hypothetical protein